MATIQRFRNRVEPATAPRMTAAEPIDSEKQPARSSVPLHRLQAILRTARLEPASAPPSAHGAQSGGYHPPVDTDQKNQQGARHVRVAEGRDRTRTPLIFAQTVCVSCCSSRAGQNRKAPREKQPFLAQFTERGLRCRGFSGRDYQPARNNHRAMQPANLTESSPYPIPNHRAAKPTRSDEPKPGHLPGRSGRRGQSQ